MPSLFKQIALSWFFWFAEWNTNWIYFLYLPVLSIAGLLNECIPFIENLKRILKEYNKKQTNKQKILPPSLRGNYS